MQKHVNVKVVVEVDGETKEFSTTAATTGEPTCVADGLIDGVSGSAHRWLRDRRIGGNRA